MICRYHLTSWPTLFPGLIIFLCAASCSPQPDTTEYPVQEISATEDTGDTFDRTENSEGSTRSPDDGGIHWEETLSLDIIDDMEDGTGGILDKKGRSGLWYIFGKSDSKDHWPPTTSPGETATSDIIPNQRGDSERAMHFIGRLSARFCKLGIGLKLSSDPTDGYDLSGYSGITFWGRGAVTGIDSPPLVSEVMLAFTTEKDTSADQTPFCDSSSEANRHPAVVVSFSEDWQKYWIFFFREGVTTDANDEEAAPWKSSVTLESVFDIIMSFNVHVDYDWLRRTYGEMSAENYDDYSSRMINRELDMKKEISDIWIDDIAFFKGHPDCTLPNTVCKFDPDSESLLL